MDSLVWPLEKAQAWGAGQPWRTGCNFIPSTAINQLEMWQAETWDPATIDRELGYAASIGMSVVRVYLHDLVWEADAEGLFERMDAFLALATKHGIHTLYTLLDDCHTHFPQLGKQPEPRPSVHNSGWVKSPGMNQRCWPGDLPRLERYFVSVLERFKHDPRVWMWDLYNEPGNAEDAANSMELLQHVFPWAWSVRPDAPLTVGVWFEDESFNEFQLRHSDIVTFHHYEGVEGLLERIEKVGASGRPVVCTEWMARTRESLVSTHLPVFERLGVSCINWGLVNGKSNTIYPWGTQEGAPEPEPWFHDLFHPNGTPYNADEARLFTELSTKAVAGRPYVA